VKQLPWQRSDRLWYGKTSDHTENAIALAELAQQRKNADFSRFELG
jgi:hypothetical protein